MQQGEEKSQQNVYCDTVQQKQSQCLPGRSDSLKIYGTYKKKAILLNINDLKHAKPLFYFNQIILTP